MRAHQGSQAATDAFFRLFLVPGMGHCAGGSGTTAFGNQGAPARVFDGVTTRTRPLCPYPRRAVYRGTGSTDDASGFVCR